MNSVKVQHLENSKMNYYNYKSSLGFCGVITLFIHTSLYVCFHCFFYLNRFLGCPQQFLQRAGAPRFPQHAKKVIFETLSLFPQGGPRADDQMTGHDMS